MSAQYASIPRTPDGRGVHNLLASVAPGGTLLVVSHDLEPMRAPIDTTAHSQAFDPDAYLRVDDFAAALSDDPDWTIEVHRRHALPGGLVRMAMTAMRLGIHLVIHPMLRVVRDDGKLRPGRGRDRQRGLDLRRGRPL